MPVLSDNDKWLGKCLQSEGRKTLPKPYSGKGSWIWIRAIALVAKSDGTENYCVFENDGANARIVKDFGSQCPISAIRSIHPTVWLSPSDIPQIESLERAQSYLRHGGIDPEETKRMYESDRIGLRCAVIKTAAMLAARESKFRSKLFSNSFKRRRRRK